jgi:protein O-mannosyl-transferase
MKRYRNEIITCFFLILAILAVFAQIRNHEFITYDDPAYVTKNLEVQAGWTLKSVIWAFTGTVQGLWHPITLLSHMTDCQFFGLNPAGHHLSSLFFHIANTLLLFLALRIMTGTLMQSAFVAALFAIHPLHVESVAWVADRKDLLAALFWLFSIVAYSSYAKRSGLSRYALVLIIFALGLLSKAVDVTLPAVLLLLDYWPLKRLKGTGESKKDHKPQPDSGSFSSVKRSASALILEKVPFFILAAVFTLMTAWVMQTAVTKEFAAPKIMASTNHISQALVFYVTYIAKMFWPAHLALPYPRPGQVPGWQAAGAAIILSVVSLFVFWKGRRYPYLPVGWLWYLVTLVPVIGIAKFGPHDLADRYTYIPLIGLFIMISWSIPDLVRKLPHNRAFLGVAGSAAVGVLMACSWIQTGYWKNNISLFRHTISVTANNFQAENDLGLTLKRQGKLDEGIKHLREAVRINPGMVRQQYNLGLALAQKGDLFEAALHLSKAVALMPDNARAHHHLGITLARMGKFDAAIAQFKRALEISPDYAEAHDNLGAALAVQGKLDQAIAQFKEALRVRPGYKKAERNLHHALELKRRAQAP